MKRKLFYIIIFATVALFVQCHTEAYRILCFDKMEFVEDHTGSTDTWHGYYFELKVTMGVKEVNPRYVQCLEFLSPVERCYAAPRYGVLYYKNPDLQSAELSVDRDLVYDNKRIAAGTNILPMASEVSFWRHPDNYIIICFGDNENPAPAIEIADGEATLRFCCNVGNEKMEITKTITIDLIQ